MLSTPIKQSPEGNDFTIHNEGIRLKSYPDAGGWAIGVGHNGMEVKPGMIWTMDEVMTAFHQDMSYREEYLRDTLNVAPTQGQADALLDWLFNIKESDWDTATILKKAVEGDWTGAWNEFPKWIYSGGTVNVNLLKRRRLEQAVFLGQSWQDYLAQCDGKPWWPTQFSEEA